MVLKAATSGFYSGYSVLSAVTVPSALPSQSALFISINSYQSYCQLSSFNLSGEGWGGVTTNNHTTHIVTVQRTGLLVAVTEILDSYVTADVWKQLLVKSVYCSFNLKY